MIERISHLENLARLADVVRETPRSVAHRTFVLLVDTDVRVPTYDRNTRPTEPIVGGRPAALLAVSPKS